jgi:hypothetical protein
MHNADQKTALHAFVENRLGSTEQPEPERVTAARERNEVLKAKGEAVHLWRAIVNEAEPADRIDGAKLGQLTEALGGVGFVSEVLGLRPFDIEQAIKHSQGTFLSEKAVRKFISAAQAVQSRGA